MKKYILKILLFFGIVAVVDFGFGITCEWLQNHAKGGRMKGVRQSAIIQTADIVIMGSSRAHHHYVPSVITKRTGMTSHNAGVNGNGIVLVSGLFDLMEERYTPKVVLYDVTPAFDFNVYTEDGNNTRYIGWLRPYYWQQQVKKIVCRVNSSERYKNFSMMFRYNSKIADLLKDQVVTSDYTKDGYAPLKGKMKSPPQQKTGNVEIVQDTLKYHMMEEFIAKLSKSDSRLIMIASPRYGVTTSDVFEPIKALCKKYGVEFWDYYCASDFQKMDYFKESMHLNDTGAKVFSEFIAEKLVSGNILLHN